jgi:N-formylglutamate deformylase
MTPVYVMRGDSPVVLGMPHTGTFLPDPIWERLNENGQLLADTDWHVDQLYEDLLPGATTVRANFHRYVIDANRDPSGESLYPGKNTTGLIPETDFDGEPIWEKKPDQFETAERLNAWHAPYHAALASELKRVHEIHGCAILYDCHSIRSKIPYLFDDVLPDFNLGTNNGRTCASVIEESVGKICNRASGYSTVVNGRFKGGWTTRNYGNPGRGFHAIQMELAQGTHLEAEQPPFAYDDDKAEKLRGYLREILERLDALGRSGRLASKKPS